MRVFISLDGFVEVKRGVFVSIQADGFVGIVFFCDEDGSEVSAEGFEVIPFFLLEMEEFLAVVFFGALVFLEESEGLLLLFFLLVEDVLLGEFFFLALFGIALVLSVLFEVGEFLLLVFDLGFEDKLGSRFDGVVVHRLEFVAGGVAAVDHFVDLVANALCPFKKGLVGGELVEFRGSGFEGFEVEGSGEADDIGREGIDEIGDGVVGFTEHLLDVAEFEKDHEFCGDEGFVCGANTGDVEIHLVGDDAEFFEAKCARDFLAFPVIAMPLKLVKGFGGGGDVDGGAH